MKKHILFSILLLAAYLPSSIWAAQLIGVKMPDELTVGSAKLLLNGMGIRKKEIALGLGVNVYVAGLYVTKKSQDPTELLNLPMPKQVHMVFTHSVGKDSLKGAWDESFKKNCTEESKCNSQQALLAKFEATLVDVENGDTMDYIFEKDAIRLLINGKVRGETSLKTSLGGESLGSEFEKTLLKAWLGEAPNADLKKGLLGLSASNG